MQHIYPGLRIAHRPGRVHSNVDPLSCLPRIPQHNSPIRDVIKHIEPELDKVELARKGQRRVIPKSKPPKDSPQDQDPLTDSHSLDSRNSQTDQWTYPANVLPTDAIPSEDWIKRSHLLVSMNADLIREFSKAYSTDP